MVIDEGRLNTNPLRINGVDYQAGNSGVDSTTECLLTVDYAHGELHGGSHFYVKEATATIPINNYFDIQFTVADTVKWPHWELIFTTSSEFEYWFYEGVTINNSDDDWIGIDRNRNTHNTAGMLVHSITNANLAAANADTAIASAAQLAHGKTGSGRQVGGSGSSRKELILWQNKSYSMRFFAAAAGYIDWLFDWYEHTNKN